MNDIHCSIVGNAVTDVRTAVTRTGHHVATFRLASTTRRFNRESERWEDLDTSFLTVACWRSLADNVVASVRKGDPVVVVGRLRVREYIDQQGRSGINVELEATSVGHDLGRGTSAFTRVARREPVPDGSEAQAPAAPAPASGGPGIAA